MENETGPLDMRPLLLKRFVWDIFPHDTDIVKGVQKSLGLVPDGDDGLEVEHDASDVRISRVSRLSATLHVLSGISAEVIAHYVITSVKEASEDDDAEIPEGFLEAFASQNAEIIYDSVFAIISHLMDTGVLDYGRKVRQA